MLLVRGFTPRDLGRVYDIECKSFKDPYHVMVLLNLYELYPESFFVAEEDGVVVGYVISRRVDTSGHVLAIATDPGHRGRGIGKVLMATVMEHFLKIGARDIWLEVRASNEVAIWFYKGLGFGEAGRARGYYSDGEEALIFKKKLGKWPTFSLSHTS